ncbi:restriction endonuclease [Noviherbaspirillum sedimenti]|nr:restriction endonuclease [Noviherbaspirillum sedimenti]
MNQNKEIISQIAGIENWSEFEEFVKDLYAQNDGTIHVERNYKAKGASGRNREVDVIVKFGFNPHIIALGIECKYWSQKVDGDIIDVAYAKKEDLKLDKYAVITTVGFEAGAELYAKSKGIDLFIIRPSEDDDFGYTGRIIKFKMYMQGSRPICIKFNASIIAEQGHEADASAYVQSKLSNIVLSEKDADLDSTINLYRYTVETTPDGITSYTRGNYVNNLAKLILETWRTQNSNFWNKQPSSFAQKIRFEKPTAIFFPNRIVVSVNEIDFTMQYIKSESEFEIDRGRQYPMILENVIENAVTPLSASPPSTPAKFMMCESSPKREINLADKPDDAVGRDGVTIHIQCSAPMSISDSDQTSIYYKLVSNENGIAWAPINATNPNSDIGET